MATLSDKLEIEINATGDIRADMDRLLVDLEKGRKEAEAILEKTPPDSDLFGLRERAAHAARDVEEQVRKARANIDSLIRSTPIADPSDARIKIAETTVPAAQSIRPPPFGWKSVDEILRETRAASSGTNEVADSVQNVGRRLDEVGGKAQSAVASLLRIGGATVAIYAVGSALSEGVRRAEEFESALLRAASIDPAQYGPRSSQIADQAKEAAKAFGLEEVEAAKLRATIALLTDDVGRGEDLARAGGVAALANVANAAEAAKSIARLQDAYGVAGQSATALANTAAVASRRLDDGFTGLVEAVRESRPELQAFGITAEDAIALFATAAQKSTGSIRDASQGYRQLLQFVTDLNGSARKSFESVGVRIDESGRGLSGLLSIIEQIRAIPPDTLATIIGSPAQLENVRQVLQATRADVLGTQADIAKQPDYLKDLAEAVGNRPSEQIDRFVRGYKESLTSFGSAFLSFSAKIANERIELPVDVVLPENLTKIADDVRTRVVAGDIEGARAEVAQLESVAANGGAAYAKAFEDARSQYVARAQRKFFEAISKYSGPTGAPVFDAKKTAASFDPQRSLEKFIAATKEMARISRAILDDAVESANPKPIEVPLKPRIDPAIAQIDRTLRDYRFVVNLQFGAPTEEVQQAVSRLVELKVKSQSTRLPLQGPDAVEANRLERIVSQFSTTRAQLDDTLSAIVAENSGGLAKMALEMRASEQRISDAIYKAELAPNDLASALLRLEEFKQSNNEKLAATYRQKTGELESLRLSETNESLQKAQQLALAQGNVNQADALAVQIIEAKAAAERQAAEAANASRREQNKGLFGTIEVLDEIRKRQLEQVEADRQVALAAQQRTVAERERARVALFVNTRSEALQGLEAELQKIAQIRAERDAVLQTDTRIRFGLDPEEVQRILDFNRAIEERDRAIARRNATLFQVESIGRSLNEVTSSYDAQVSSLRLLRGLEESRLRDSLIAAGVERTVLEAQLRLYEALTDKAEERLAVQEALKSAAETTRTNLLENAAAEAGNRGLQGTARDEFIRNSQNGSGAFDQGFTSGVLDATRALTDFSSGLRTGQQLASGFRDSTSNALQGIGSKSGTDVLRDFARSNLENIRKVFADNAADTITKGLFTSLLGKDAASKLASPDEKLKSAADVLSKAGIDLSTAAQLLQVGALGKNQRALELLGPSQLAGATIPGGVPEPPSAAQGTAPEGPPPTGSGQQGPNPDGSTVQEGAQQLGQAGQVAGSALTAGARQAAASLAQGGQGFLQNFLGGFGGKLSDALSGGILKGLGISASFAEGGVYSGVSVRSSLSPKANRLGGIYSQRTLIEVAEVPGAQEAVIPMRGGAIPVEMRGGNVQATTPVRGPLEEGIVALARDLAETRRSRGGADGDTGSRAAPYDPFSASPGRQAPDRVQRAIDVAPARGSGRSREGGSRVTRVTHAPTVNIAPGSISVTVHAAPGMDATAISEQVSRQLAEQVPKVVTSALVNGTDRKLVNAVRDAVR